MKTFSIPDVFIYEGVSPGPTVVVNGGTHGDEWPGIETVESLKTLAEAQGVLAGKLILSLGNTLAMAQTPPVRSLHPKDLNKSFGHPVLGPDGKLTFESLRAQQLKAVFAQADLLLDLHATIKPSEPMVVAPNLNHALTSQVLPNLGIEHVFTGSGLLPPSGEPIYADTFVAACGGLGLTVEAGWIEDPGVRDLTDRVKQVLAALGILSPLEKPMNASPIKIWDAYWNVIADDQFKFTQEWGNFDPLPAGTVFATTATGPLAVPDASIMLFPKPSGKIVTGQEACIIARSKTPQK